MFCEGFSILYHYFSYASEPLRSRISTVLPILLQRYYNTLPIHLERTYNALSIHYEYTMPAFPRQNPAKAAGSFVQQITNPEIYTFPVCVEYVLSNILSALFASKPSLRCLRLISAAGRCANCGNTRRSANST